MNLDRTLIDVSVVAGAVYGTALIGREPSGVRTAVKVPAVGCLPVAAYLLGAPLPLIAALTASAVGDGFLAGDPEHWLAGGRAAFLLAGVGRILLVLPGRF